MSPDTRAELQDELRETEDRLERLLDEKAKLEVAIKAKPTDAEQAEMQRKVDAARANAQKNGQDPEMVDRLVQATRDTFLEKRAGVGDRFKSVRQQIADLNETRILLKEKLGGRKAA